MNVTRLLGIAESASGRISLERMTRIAQRWLPPQRLYHPYPAERLIVSIQGKSPVR